MSRKRGMCYGLAPAIVGAMACAARAQVVWNEFTQGDLSDNRFAPTSIPLSPGSNQLVGLMAGDLGGGVIDRDYFTITIPQGYVLSQLVLESYFSNDPVAFLAVQPGPIFPNDPITVQSEDLLGWIHLAIFHVGEDILPIMGSQGQGFTPPLTGSTYTFWAQQLGEPTDYVLDFVVTVPAPPTAGVLLMGAFLARRRRE